MARDGRDVRQGTGQADEPAAFTPTPVSIGLDLAWGARAATGVCIAIGDRVVDSASLHTDEEIHSTIRPWLGPATIIAVDAPLIVRNHRGQRRAETLVGRLYGAAGASAHSSNLSMPAFADGGRAARLAALLGAGTDPAGRMPVMAEVYPHAGLVSLFGLTSTLPYKAKRHRTVGGRKAAFAEVAERLESLADFDPPLDVATAPRWGELRDGVQQAATGVALDRIEDEIDAFVCAYVGLYWIRWGDRRCAVLGSADDGYILTPIDPARRTRLAELTDGDAAATA